MMPFGVLLLSEKTTEQYLSAWVVFLVDLGSDVGLWGEGWVTYLPKRLIG